MGRLSRVLLGVALLGMTIGAQPAAHAATSANCKYPGTIWIGPIIFPPIACQVALDPGTYHLDFSWTHQTWGFVVLGAGDQDTNAVYFNIHVQAGLVTHYQTETGEKYPPPKPPLLGPVKGNFTLKTPGGISLAVFPEQIPAPTQSIVIPAGSFHLVVTPA